MFLAAFMSTPGAATPPRVVTDMPLTAALVQSVMGDLGQPTALLDDGADPHHFQIRASQARAMQDGDILIWMGPELTPWLARAASGFTQQIALLHDETTDLRDMATARNDKPQDHHATASTYQTIDPHAWLNPQNGIGWTNAIADRLSDLDPENSAIYLQNARAAVGQIAATEQQIARDMAPLSAETFVTLHDAYGYFTGHFGLEPSISVSLGDAASPSAARLRLVNKVIAAKKPVCAFPEANQPTALIDDIAAKAGLRMGDALSPSGIGLEPGESAYIAALLQLASRISACLRPSG